jgi:hypothetical protein
VCDTVQSGRCYRCFGEACRQCQFSPISVLWQEASCYITHVSVPFSLFQFDSLRAPVTRSLVLYPEDRGSVFLRNVVRFLADYTTSYLRRLICMQIHYQIYSSLHHICNKIIMVLREILSVHVLVAGNYSASRLICQH